MIRRQGVYWLLTIPEDEFEPHLPQDCAYIKGQKERGEHTGYLHWQVLVVLRRKGSLSTITGMFGVSCHAELSRSAAASEYVWKEDTRVGDQFEFGTLPFKRNDPKDWEQIWECAKAGDINGIPADVRIQCYRTLRTIRADFAVPAAMVRQCFVFCGPTGTGKSRRAWDEAGMDAYPKDPRTKFWDGYRDHKHVVIDEFRGAIDISHILRWLDRYPTLVEIKGSATCLVAEKLWITSNVHPNEWYPMLDSATVDALLRRLQITVFE
jgi:hypothetical protein